MIQPGEQLVNIGRATGSLVDQCLLQPRQQLGPFLHDRQVGGEVRVEDGVETESPQSRDHLAGHQRAGRVAETLAQRRADGRRRLHDDVLVGIVQRVPDLVDLVLFGDRSDRADRRTLAALHAGHRTQVAIERGTDHGVEAAVLRATVRRRAASRHRRSRTGGT